MASSSSPQKNGDEKLVKAMHDLTKELRAVHQVEVKMNRRQYLRYFIRGILQGMGVLIAAIIVIPLLIPVILFMLQKVEWVPIIGNFASRVIEQVEEGEPRTPGAVGR